MAHTQAQRIGEADKRSAFLVKAPLMAEVIERHDTPGAWGVEAINHAGDGEIYMAVFSGPDARDLAIEYAHAKYIDVRVG